MLPDPLIVGIAGGTGSGKTTLARKLYERLPQGEAAYVQHDWYYRDRSHMTPAERDGINFDEPAALENDLLAGHLRALRAGESVDCPQYDFASHTRAKGGVRVEPRRIVLVEGILIFAVEGLRDCFDLRIFVDTDDDLRLLRRIRRDVSERGRTLESVDRQYTETVRPMHLLHVAPSKRHAHLIVPEGGENAQALDVIAGRLHLMLHSVATAP